MGTEKEIIKSVLYSEEEIINKTKQLADVLNEKYAGKEVVLVTVMSGGLPFTNLLMKYLTFDCYMDFISSSSYHRNKKISSPKIKYDAKIPLNGKHVIIIDDVIDSGETIIKVSKVLEAHGAESISTAALIVKPKRKEVNIDEYYCWEYEGNGFLVGFGLDWEEKYRNIPYVGLIKD